MTSIALQASLDQKKLYRLVHSGGALMVTALFLLIVTFVAGTMIGPKLELTASLKSRTQSIESLEAALRTQQETLSQNFQLIGANSGGGPASLSSMQTPEILKGDADALINELEAYGFELNNRSEPNERAITPALAGYSITLRLSGDKSAAEALMGGSVTSSADIKNFSLTNDGQQGVKLSLAIQRIGAVAAPGDGSASE